MADMNERLTTNFRRGEFACKCGCGFADPHKDLLLWLQAIRDVLRVPLHVNSGSRCAAHNRRVGGSINSQHIQGTAADIVRPANITWQRFVAGVLETGYIDRGGICVYLPRRIIHIDTRQGVWRQGEINRGQRAHFDAVIAHLLRSLS